MSYLGVLNHLKITPHITIKYVNDDLFNSFNDDLHKSINLIKDELPTTIQLKMTYLRVLNNLKINRAYDR